MSNEVMLSDQTADYVEKWFIPYDALVRRSGATADQIQSLIAAGAAPGIVYSQGADGKWWSALGAVTGKNPPSPTEDGQHWFSPGALYWLRRALLIVRSGKSAAEAAAGNRDAFVAQFIAALKETPEASGNFTEIFADGELNEDKAREAAIAEWADWINGSYCVCLRSFSGESCVRKESLARYLKMQYVDGQASAPELHILDKMEQLQLLLMPFAPFERPTSTCGLAVDRLLTILELGVEEPYLTYKGECLAA